MAACTTTARGWFQAQANYMHKSIMLSMHISMIQKRISTKIIGKGTPRTIYYYTTIAIATIHTYDIRHGHAKH